MYNEPITYCPSLIDLLGEELIPSGYFKEWRDVPEVQQYCRDTYGYQYPSTTSTLNAAVKKGWLVVDERYKPKRYKKVKGEMAQYQCAIMCYRVHGKNTQSKKSTEIALAKQRNRKVCLPS